MDVYHLRQFPFGLPTVNAMASRYISIFAAVCILVQVLDAKSLNGLNTRTASDDAHGALENLIQATEAASIKEINNFELKYGEFNDFLQDVITEHNDMIGELKTNAENAFNQLKKQAEEQNVDISECLDGKLDEIGALGPPLIESVQECTASAGAAGVVTREVFAMELRKIRSEATALEIMITQCEEDTCFNQIADSANKLLQVVDVKISSIVKVPISTLEYLRQGTAYCFLLPQVNYYETVTKTVQDVTTCANEKLE